MIKNVCYINKMSKCKYIIQRKLIVKISLEEENNKKKENSSSKAKLLILDSCIVCILFLQH